MEMKTSSKIHWWWFSAGDETHMYKQVAGKLLYLGGIGFVWYVEFHKWCEVVDWYIHPNMLDGNTLTQHPHIQVHLSAEQFEVHFEHPHVLGSSE